MALNKTKSTNCKMINMCSCRFFILWFFILWCFCHRFFIFLFFILRLLILRLLILRLFILFLFVLWLFVLWLFILWLFILWLFILWFFIVLDFRDIGLLLFPGDVVGYPHAHVEVHLCVLVKFRCMLAIFWHYSIHSGLL